MKGKITIPAREMHASVIFTAEELAAINALTPEQEQARRDKLIDEYFALDLIPWYEPKK
jgi:hypothetical protein